MNVVVSNEQKNILSELDIDIIKSINGEYDPLEIVEMFKNFFYNRMILDVTAIKGYSNIDSYKKIVKGLDPDKIIFFLPDGSEICTASFISNLVTTGIYNFTTNIDGVKYLLKKPNTLQDVKYLQKDDTSSDKKDDSKGLSVIGFKNLTEKAGTTTLIYMLKKQLQSHIKTRVVAIESESKDFSYFNEDDMISVSNNDLSDAVSKLSKEAIVLVDLNKAKDNSFCDEVIYLLEPSIIGINKLIRKNRDIFTKLSNKKVVLNRSLLNGKEVGNLEYEAKIKMFYNLPPLDERKKNFILDEFLAKFGLINVQNKNDVNSNRIFGLFRR